MKTEIQKLANQMDQDAENINAHDFVITHRALAVLAHAVIGGEATHKLMKALKDEKGLPGLTGICGREPKRGNILARNGISENWGDWEIPRNPQ